MTSSLHLKYNKVWSDYHLLLCIRWKTSDRVSFYKIN